MNTNVNILLTGGHAGTTALSVVGEIKKRKNVSNIHLFWIGSAKAIEGSKIQTLESQELPKLGVTCFSIITGRLQRKFSRHTIPSFLKIPIGFFHAFTLLRKIKPHVVLSFGGYAAFPVVVVSWILRIPVIVHEQTAAAGRSNLASSFFATKIALSRETSKAYFPLQKVIVTGNPIMESILSIKPKMEMGNPPVLFVTGGSRGSTSLNRKLLMLVSDWTKDFIIIHQTGQLDFEECRKVKSALPPERRDRYEIYPSINPMEMASFYMRADLILARAGANTVSEVICVKRPTLFVPLPFAYNDEQTKNAKFARDFGIAEILEQKYLNADSLEEMLRSLYSNWNEIVRRVKDKEIPDLHAASKLTDLVLSYV